MDRCDRPVFTRPVPRVQPPGAAGATYAGTGCPERQSPCPFPAGKKGHGPRR
jgi:hypothetical protein